MKYFICKGVRVYLVSSDDNVEEYVKDIKNKKMLNFKKTELKLIDPRNWK